MKWLTVLLLGLVASAGCASPPAPTGSAAPTSSAPVVSAAPVGSAAPSSASDAIRCAGLSLIEPDVCGRMVALVQQAHPAEVRDASRILVVDGCPEQVLCDRQFFYDAIVLFVPADGNAAGALALRVFGHIRQPLAIEAWSGPLPAHVAGLLAEG